MDVLFYDEAFFRRESTITRGWFPRGSRQTVACPVSYAKVGVCGAVDPASGQLVSLIFDGFDSDTFTCFLEWLLAEHDPCRQIVLVLDNARVHKSHQVLTFVEKWQERLVLVYLPPYSPDLNPVERVWKDLRYRVTHNVFFKNLADLTQAVSDYLARHAEPNERLAHLCCNI